MDNNNIYTVVCNSTPGRCMRGLDFVLNNIIVLWR